jgi:hypothetical protein
VPLLEVEVSMGGLSSNLQWAKRACAYVKRNLPRGAGNRPDGSSDAAACVLWVRENTVCAEDFIPHLAERAIQNGCGNCGEQAAVAFVYLKRQGVRPLDYMNLNNPQGRAIHSFVTIGFVGQGEESSGWGPHAVVCDPWDDSQAYAAWKIEMSMTLFVGSCSVETLFRT